MDSNTLIGCCNARYFYNLGGAHHVSSATDYDSFLKKFVARGMAPVNICITNNAQKKTNQFLEQMGWTNTKTSALNVWTISDNDAEKALRPLREQARLEALEREKQRQAQQAERTRVSLDAFKKSFSGEFTTRDIQSLRGCTLSPNEIFKEITGLTTKCQYGNLGFYTNTQVKNTYNNAIRRHQNAASS